MGSETMPLFPALCAAMLQPAGDCPSLPAAIPVTELADIRGGAATFAGLDQASALAGVRSVDLPSTGPRPSDQAREMLDNWNMLVAMPLIAEATANARR